MDTGFHGRQKHLFTVGNGLSQCSVEGVTPGEEPVRCPKLLEKFPHSHFTDSQWLWP